MKVSRREMVGWIGAAAVTVPSVNAIAAPITSSPNGQAESEVSESRSLSASDLLAPLVVGSQIGSWRVERFEVLHAGAVTVELSDTRGEHFQIDVCARDSALGAPEPPARTDRCDLFVANEGSGSDPTCEEQGLAAMALAELIRAHEHRLDLGGLLTLRMRLAQHGDDVVRRCK